MTVRGISETVDPGSFRDPGGQVFQLDNRVYRTVNPPAVDDFDYVQSTGLMETLVGRGLVLDARQVELKELGAKAEGACYVLEHPKLPFISYPYEWSFSGLKAAALCHIDVHLSALEHGVTLSDATAYNIQFIGARPVFIDRLSFVRYRDGEMWAGHRQFTEQFLNPLLLRALLGVSHNAWYRGSLEGISARDLSRLLKVRHKISWKVFSHVILQSFFQSSFSRHDAAVQGDKIAGTGFPRAALERMLRKLRGWIESLNPADAGKTTWQNYARETSYTDEETVIKRRFVGEFSKAVAPTLLMDIGCNTGDFTAVALDAGARYAVGFDFDQGALEQAYARARNENLAFQPLFLDAANQSPAQGWAERERQGFQSRVKADAVLALALVHHLAIAKNIPFDGVIDWLIGIAPTGVIEFVPKQDPMVRELLRFRQDIFADYDEETFRALVATHARVVRTEQVSASGRLLVWFDRR